jgi:hypothetical protein
MPSQGLRACGKFCHLVSSFCGPILRTVADSGRHPAAAFNIQQRRASIWTSAGHPSFLLTDSLIQVFLGHFITVSLLLCQIRVIGL